MARKIDRMAVLQSFAPARRSYYVFFAAVFVSALDSRLRGNDNRI
jgi:hypothetical protein